VPVWLHAMSGTRIRRWRPSTPKESVGVIEVLDTDDQAQERVSTVIDDFTTLAVEDWCDRYGIQLSFVTE
jgi:hypothetical protein